MKKVNPSRIVPTLISYNLRIFYLRDVYYAFVFRYSQVKFVQVTHKLNNIIMRYILNEPAYIRFTCYYLLLYK